MLKTLVFTFFAGMLFSSINAQSIRFIQYKFVEYHPESSEWDEWPSEWSGLGEDSQFEMNISAVIKGKVFNVVLNLNGEEISNLNVRYDGAQTEQTRFDWKDPSVYCYYDENGDYIYTQNVSLEQLAKDSEPWKNENSQMYFLFFNDNYGYAFR
jgi:hypothetical protein